MKLVSTATVLLVFATGLLAQPEIARTQNQSTDIRNNYSYIIPGMPNYGIAQGSIVDIFGANLATITSPLQSVPLPTKLNGTSVQFTINHVTTQAILYFVSPAQIAAIIPSATPAGTGQMTVTVNGQTSPPAPITVVETAFGMLSLNGAGNGPAAAEDASFHLLNWTNAANPGDFITLWGTGLGPVTGDETQAQQPVNLTHIPIEVDIGGRSALVQYHGRSQYPGLDQINVQVPVGVTGCHVSVVVRSGDMVSNFGTIPVAAGGRICSEPVAGLSAGQIEGLLSQPSINRGVIAFTGDSASVQFLRFANAQYAARQPGTPVSFNDCTVLNYVNVHFGVPNPIQPVPLDAGPSISFTPPSGTGIGDQTLPFQGGSYAVSGLMATGSLKGTYTFTGTGGADIGPFSAQVRWPGGAGGFNFSTPGNSGSVTRASGMTVTWSQPSHTDPDEYIEIFGFAFVPNLPFGAEFVCNVPLAVGFFAIPPAVLLAMPPQVGLATPQATLEVDLIITKPFAARGADTAAVTFFLADAQSFSYQ